MKKKNIILAGAMTAILAISGQFVQSDNFFGTKTVEAFGLGDIAKIGGKALGVDVDQLEDKRQNMILNLAKAAICYGQSAIDVSEALDLNPEQLSQMKAALTNLKSNRTDLGAMKQVGESTKMNQKDIEEKAQSLMDSNDQEKIARANELIKKAKSERQAANLYKIMAARDAGIIISGAAKAMVSSDSLGDKIAVVKDLSAVANTAKAVADVIGNNHKVMTNALKTYEKKNNIPEVKDKDADKLMKDVGLE